VHAKEAPKQAKNLLDTAVLAHPKNPKKSKNNPKPKNRLKTQTFNQQTPYPHQQIRHFGTNSSYLSKTNIKLSILKTNLNNFLTQKNESQQTIRTRQ
jgi:hypothetical protein